jgi:hypothetical protein
MLIHIIRLAILIWLPGGIKMTIGIASNTPNNVDVDATAVSPLDIGNRLQNFVDNASC